MLRQLLWAEWQPMNATAFLDRAGREVCVVVASPRANEKAFLDDVLACAEARASQKLRARGQVAEQGWGGPWWELRRCLLR
eukprot:14563548-Alexandrium_andersonii.AAC.1